MLIALIVPDIQLVHALRVKVASIIEVQYAGQPHASGWNSTQLDDTCDMATLLQSDFDVA